MKKTVEAFASRILGLPGKLSYVVMTVVTVVTVTTVLLLRITHVVWYGTSVGYTVYIDRDIYVCVIVFSVSVRWTLCKVAKITCCGWASTASFSKAPDIRAVGYRGIRGSSLNSR